MSNQISLSIKWILGVCYILYLLLPAQWQAFFGHHQITYYTTYGLASTSGAILTTAVAWQCMQIWAYWVVETNLEAKDAIINKIRLAHQFALGLCQVKTVVVIQALATTAIILVCAVEVAPPGLLSYLLVRLQLAWLLTPYRDPRANGSEQEQQQRSIT